MNFLSAFKEKAANKGQSQRPQPEVITSTFPMTVHNPTGSDLFNGLGQSKLKSATTGQFNPFNIGASVTQPSSATIPEDYSQMKTIHSAALGVEYKPNSFLSSDGESFDVNSQEESTGQNGIANSTGEANQEATAKRSAFSFIKKPTGAQTKVEGNTNIQTTGFQNTTVAKQDNPFQSQNLLETLDFSNDLNGSQGVEAKPNSSFPMVFKAKQPSEKSSRIDSLAEVGTRKPSIDMTTEIEKKISIGSIPTSHSDIKTEKSESRTKIENNNEQGGDSGVKKTGPAFMKFKQKTVNNNAEEPKDNTSVSSKGDLSIKHGNRSNGYETTPKRVVSEENIEEVSKKESPSKEKANAQPKPLPVSPVKSQEDPNDLKARLQSEKEALMGKIGNVMLRQNKIVANKESFEAQKEQLLTKLKEYGKQQNRAIENDNFEEADRLEALIVQTNQKIKNIDKEIDSCQSQHMTLENEKNALYEQMFAVYKTSSISLEKAVLNRNHVFEKYKLDCLSQQSMEKLHIEEETERLQLQRNHLDLDLKHIEEESNTLEKNIEKQTKDYVQNQKDLSAHKTELEIEIEQLRRELEMKEAELAEVTESLDKVSDKINGIRGKFSDHLHRIKTKKEKYEKDEGVYTREVDKLNQYKKKNEKSLEEYNKVISEHQNTMQAYEEFKNKIQNDSSKEREENAKREMAFQKYNDSLKRLTEVKNVLSSRAEEIENLREGLTRIQKETTDVNTQKSSLEAKIPELEAEKKTFVASRSFKDASRISNEIKDMQTKVQDLDHRLVELASKEKLQIQKISSLEKNMIPQLASQVDAAMKNCDVDKYHLLRIREKDLALCVEFFINKKQDKEASVIESELNGIKLQIQDLKYRYPELVGSVSEEKTKQESDEETHNQSGSNICVEYPTESEMTREDTNKVNETDEGEYSNLAACAAEYEALNEKINELEGLIEQLASEEKFDEADEMSRQQSELKQKQEALIKNIQLMGFNSVDELRESLGNH